MNLEKTSVGKKVLCSYVLSNSMCIVGGVLEKINPKTISVKGKFKTFLIHKDKIISVKETK